MKPSFLNDLVRNTTETSEKHLGFAQLGDFRVDVVARHSSRDTNFQKKSLELSLHFRVETACVSSLFCDFESKSASSCEFTFEESFGGVNRFVLQFRNDFLISRLEDVSALSWNLLDRDLELILEEVSVVLCSVVEETKRFDIIADIVLSAQLFVDLTEMRTPSFESVFLWPLC
jgi:hypothetical protein